LFVLEVFGLVFSVRAFTGLEIPLMGPGLIALPSGLAPGGVSVSVNVEASFGWPFFLAIAVVVLCITARLYHRKIAKTETANVPTPPTPAANESLIS
jgi:membrane protein implicated in regulation of membrane protease activity